MHEARFTPEELAARVEARCAPFAPPPRVELPDLHRALLFELAHEGSGEFDHVELGLAHDAVFQNALDLAIAEGLRELTVGDRLCRVGLRLDDYAREVLDLQPRTAMKRVRLAKLLRTRPLLREAFRTGKVSLRAAEVVAPVARGEAEARWVGLASTETVRALEEAVQREGKVQEEDEEWGRLRLGASPEDLDVIDLALERAGQELPGSKPFERLEAMAQEFLGGHPEVAPEMDPPPGGLFRCAGQREAALAQRKAVLEQETDRWVLLEPIPRRPAPEVRWDEITTAEELDLTLRKLAEHREAWDARVAWLACELKESGLWKTMGFASFGHYVEERLGQPRRALEQRVRLEERIRRSPALRKARDGGLSYERLRALARLDEADIVTWIPRARDLTVVALRDELEAHEQRQMRARRRFGAAVPVRIACLLAAAIEAARALAREPLPPGRCLALVALHFLDTHGPLAKPRTPSQKVRARDRWRCSVPGCSHLAEHAHHIEFLSQGGARTDPANQTALCAFHHHCVHHGYLRLEGSAPGGLAWSLGGGRRDERGRSGALPIGRSSAPVESR